MYVLVRTARIRVTFPPSLPSPLFFLPLFRLTFVFSCADWKLAIAGLVLNVHCITTFNIQPSNRRPIKRLYWQREWERYGFPLSISRSLAVFLIPACNFFRLLFTLRLLPCRLVRPPTRKSSLQLPLSCTLSGSRRCPKVSAQGRPRFRYRYILSFLRIVLSFASSVFLRPSAVSWPRFIRLLDGTSCVSLSPVCLKGERRNKRFLHVGTRTTHAFCENHRDLN